ncbi:MAG TPA: hypothetical protein DCS07_05715 [Bdellovibrionales bacterium]|nr:hypothetical protein [Bdellovibrionales bacterium]
MVFLKRGELQGENVQSRHSLVVAQTYIEQRERNMTRLSALFAAVFVLAINNVYAAPGALESALRSVDRFSWTFRPNNLYRWASYVPNSAKCNDFPGTNGSRIGCSVLIQAEVDVCPSERPIFDQLVFRILMTKDGRIISTAHDGGDNSTAAACVD